MSMKRRLGRDRQAQVVPLSGRAEALAGLAATTFAGHPRGGKVVGCTSLQDCVGGIFSLFRRLDRPFSKAVHSCERRGAPA